MRLTGIGIALRRINHSDLEMVRKWRNQPRVRSQMFRDEIISQIQQIEWFQSIDNANNYYFVILENEIPLGLIFAKNINQKTNEGEGGIFMGDLSKISSDIPARASLLLLYFCFNCLCIKRSKIRVKTENTQALSFNLSLGYKCIDQIDDALILEATLEDFESAPLVKKLSKYLALDSIRLTGQPSEKNLACINDWLKSYR